MHPFRTLEITAERIADGPQTSLDVVQALQKLVGKLERWRLLYVWECLRFDVAAEPHRLMGAQQNLNEALNGIAMKLKMERMDIVALSKLASRDWAR